MSREYTCQCRAFKAGATLLIGLAAGCLMSCPRVGEAKAQEARSSLPRTSPMPPPRPAELGGQPTPPPQTTPGAGPIPPAGGSNAATPPSTTGTNASPPPDILLDREAIRSCGTQWQQMKMDGSASGKSWREFARECAARGAGIRQN
ncbi:hypothetical protein PY365_15405 [Roseiarcaceae bacterium H3SJ34-1]|uniref:hypothetical protein n=1 Tax=Terripilifer ovatus TaxID=3032367 RepID=UPI003AB9390A|nr:hypothetical protein [Roseiarcaceae bacterium H3SJ34-1]